MTAEDSLRRAEELLDRLEHTRAELENVAESQDSEAAIEVLTELAEIAKEVEAELTRAKREAEAEAG
jgi:hypothetical protein